MNPLPIGTIIGAHCPCWRPATVAISAVGPTMRRAINACPNCEPRATKWAARAGPVTKRPIDQPETTDTLF